MFSYPIAISLSPNTEKSDVLKSVKTLFIPNQWKIGNAVFKLEEWFRKYLEVDNAVSFNSGRSALYAILKSFDIGKGDEVLVQAFSCVAVPNAVTWTGAKPKYIDVDDSLNIDNKLLEKQISIKTKAIIIQHTFGIPANIDMIKKITQKYKILLIEDCAHSLGANIRGKKIGSYGDAAFFSFGRDKVVSSVFGGLAIINIKNAKVKYNLRNIRNKCLYPSYYWILQQLLHPIFFYLVLPLYNIYIGKLILFLLQKIKLLSKPIYKEELSGIKPDIFPSKMPNALASLLLNQLDKIDRYNQMRINHANYYFRHIKKKDVILPVRKIGSIYLRFNILVDNSEELLARAKHNKMILGNWYKHIIDPSNVDYEKIGYKIGSCAQAEKFSKLSVNLPTYPRLSQDDLDNIVNFINNV